jgi:hypothetical protein
MTPPAGRLLEREVAASCLVHRLAHQYRPSHGGGAQLGRSLEEGSGAQLWLVGFGQDGFSSVDAASSDCSPTGLLLIQLRDRVDRLSRSENRPV